MSSNSVVVPLFLKYFDDVLISLNLPMRLEWIRHDVGELCYTDILFNIHDVKLLNWEVDYYSLGTETVWTARLVPLETKQKIRSGKTKTSFC